MGHIINPISIRVKRHGLWQVEWNCYFRKDYSFYFVVGIALKGIFKNFKKIGKMYYKIFFYEFNYLLYDSILLLHICFKFLTNGCLTKYVDSNFKKTIGMSGDRKVFLSRIFNGENIHKSSQRGYYYTRLKNIFSKKQYNNVISKNNFIINSSKGSYFMYILLCCVAMEKSKFNRYFDFFNINLYKNKYLNFSTFIKSSCFNKYLLKQEDLIKVEKFKYLFLYKLILKKSKYLLNFDFSIATQHNNMLKQLLNLLNLTIDINLFKESLTCSYQVHLGLNGNNLELLIKEKIFFFSEKYMLSYKLNCFFKIFKYLSNYYFSEYAFINRYVGFFKSEKLKYYFNRTSYKFFYKFKRSWLTSCIHFLLYVYSIVQKYLVLNKYFENKLNKIKNFNLLYNMLIYILILRQDKKGSPMFFILEFLKLIVLIDPDEFFKI